MNTNIDISRIIELRRWDDIKNKLTTFDYISIEDLFSRYHMSLIFSYDKLNNYNNKIFIDPLTGDSIEESSLYNSNLNQLNSIFLILKKDNITFISPVLDNLLDSINSLLYVSEKNKDDIKSVTEDTRAKIISNLRNISDIDLLSNLEKKITAIIDTDSSIESIPNGQVGFSVENGVGYIYDINNNFRISVEFICISNDLFKINSIEEF